MTISENLGAFNQDFGIESLDYVPSSGLDFYTQTAMGTFSKSLLVNQYVNLKNSFDYSSRNDEINKIAGDDFWGAIDAAVSKPSFGDDLETYQQRKDEQIDAQIEKLRLENPKQWQNIKTNKEINYQNTEFVRAQEKQTDDVSRRYEGGAVSRFLLGFAGGVTGGVLLDPYNAATMAIGMPSSMKLLPKILGEAAINMGIEAAQTPARLEFEKQAGVRVETPAEITTNILTAGAGAGVLTAAGHGLGKILSGSSSAIDRKIAKRELEDIAQKSDDPEIKSIAEFSARNMQLSQKPDSFKGVDGDVFHSRNLDEAQRAFEEGRFPEYERADLTQSDWDAIESRTLSMPEKDIQVILNKIGKPEEDIYARAKQVLDDLQKKINIPSEYALRKELGYAPKSLSQFIKEKGGIVDNADELKSRGITQKSLVGLLRDPDKIKYKKGASDLTGAKQGISRQADYVKQELYDAGYFPSKNSYDEITDSELYDAIAKDLSGNKIYDDVTAKKIEQLTGADAYKDSLYEAGFDEKMSIDDIANRIKELEDFGVKREVSQIDLNNLDESDAILRDLLYDEIEKTKDLIFPIDNATIKLQAAPKITDGEAEANLAYMIKHNPEAAFLDEDGNITSLADFLETLQYERNLEEALTTCGIK